MALGLKAFLGGLGVLGAGGGIIGVLVSNNTAEKNISREELGDFEALTEEEKKELEKYRVEANTSYGEMCDNWGIKNKPKLRYIEKICKDVKWTELFS